MWKRMDESQVNPSERNWLQFNATDSLSTCAQQLGSNLNIEVQMHQCWWQNRTLTNLKGKLHRKFSCFFAEDPLKFTDGDERFSFIVTWMAIMKCWLLAHSDWCLSQGSTGSCAWSRWRTSTSARSRLPASTGRWEVKRRAYIGIQLVLFDV